MVLAWMLAKLFWSMADATKPELIVPVIQHNAELNRAESLSPSPIYLFGRAEKQVYQPKVKTQEEVKKTRLNLKLLGVLVAPGFGIAIIENKGQSESYSLDETIQKGVVLKEVYPDYVVISHNGLLEKLQMVQDEEVFVQSADSAELSERQLKVLSSVKENALKNPISIMRYVRFQMVQKNGKVDSVKVWPQKEAAIFRSLGFKPGDELKTVDGYTVAELSQSPTLWKTLLTKTNLELTVIRNGQTQSVSVQLD